MIYQSFLAEHSAIGADEGVSDNLNNYSEILNVVLKFQISMLKNCLTFLLRKENLKFWIVKFKSNKNLDWLVSYLRNFDLLNLNH